MVDDANAVMRRAGPLQGRPRRIDVAPIHRPIAGNFRMSSGFGNRTDPFTGGKAFHSGIDFPAPRARPCSAPATAS